MRDVVLQQYAVSLDGFSCADDSDFQKFAFGIVDPEVDEQFVESLGRSGTHIMGRVAYEGMSQHFPELSGPIAEIMNGTPKVVFSRSLERADWTDSRIARGEIAEEIAALKGESGGEILAHGGFRFAQSLVREDLVDEFRLYLFPVALGRGTSIFSTVEQMRDYRVVSFTQFPSGVVLQVLRRAVDDVK